MRLGGHWLLAGVVLGLGFTGGAWGLVQHTLPSEESLPGTQVEGWVQPSGEALVRWMPRLARHLDAAPFELWLDDNGVPEVFEFSLGELGVTLDIEATTSALLEHAQRGEWKARLRRAGRARRGEEKIEPQFVHDGAVLRETLEALAPQVERAPKDAVLDLRGHQKIPDESGLELDVGATLPAVFAAIQAGERRAALVTGELPARVQLSSLVDVDVSLVLAAYETDFKGKAGARAVNIARAAAYLDGTLLLPGEVLSFNRVVGERRLERGFVYAPVIVEDEMEPGVGGGVCQVATTLHAAAVFGDLEVIRRRSHSRPSGYAPLGLDATVIDNEVDLRLKNPYDVPLLVHAFLPTKTTIRVELLGHQLPQEVEHKYAVTERHDFVRRVKFKASVSEPVRKQRGSYGYDIVSLVEERHPDGRRESRRYPSKYYPVPEVYWVPEGFDLSALPELPEGAVDTVIGNGAPAGAESEAEANPLADDSVAYPEPS